jgi:hypothetical protein
MFYRPPDREIHLEEKFGRIDELVQMRTEVGGVSALKGERQDQADHVKKYITN